MVTSLKKEIVLTPEQEEAESLIEEWFFHLNTQIFVLCGYAGTGKTALVDYTVRRLGLKAGVSAVFVAPTGKAASVLIRGGAPASTLHSLIYTREEDIEVDENGEVISERFLRFVKKESLSKDIQLIVVDETSMVSDEILRDLLSFGIKCLFCGDPAQLPPVNGTNTLLSMPCATLTKIVRQEEGNPIVRLAERAREGKFIDYGDYGEGVSVIPRRSLDAERRKELFLEADQIIVGTNRTRSYLNREIRSCLGIPPEAILPCDGEKIVCTLNDWSKTLDESGNFHLVNGIVGQCFNVREGEDGLALLDFKPDFLENVVYDLPFDTGVFTEGRYFHGYGNKACLLQNGALVHERNTEALRRFKVRREDTVCRFEFAYALTCHKAQGSEYDFVVVLDESNLFENGREWLYTAITRAKKRLLIIR
ncbi:MAG: ATP-dependent RecD-like DNA helicase [Candidatus Gallimonas sp.]